MRRIENALTGVSKFAQSAFFILTLSALLAGCSTRARAVSSVNRFDTVDALISQNQTKDAVKELKKLSRKVYDSWVYIGIYKRYSLLGEKQAAEKLLEKAVKKNPKNLELCAVYGNFLLNNGKIQEAEKVTGILKNTKYASIYAEAVFRTKPDSFAGSYKDQRFFDLFYDSYNASLNPVWIRNCAAFFLTKGLYEQAANLTPASFNDADDAWFWAMVNFDAGDYYTAIDACRKGSRFLESLGKSRGSMSSDISISALEADSFLALGDEAASRKAAQKIIQKYVNSRDISDVTGSDNRILPLLVVNTARSENREGNDHYAAELLTYSVVNFPEYVPGLIAYADFAWNSNQMRREDDETAALRKAGIFSREMERYDSRAKIPVSDALERIDQGLSELNDPYLYIKKLDLRYKMNPGLTVKDKTTDLWKLLESSSSETVRYHDILVQYAVVFLLGTGQEEAAEELFRKYMTDRYSYNLKDGFFEQASLNVRTQAVPDSELAAFFAVRHKRTEEALRLYEYCVFESAGNRTKDISPKVSTVSAMNLAEVYYALGKQDKALDLYGKAAARETDSSLRSEIFYRIASIYFAFGDNQNALRAADYACTISPENAKAHLLKTKIR